MLKALKAPGRATLKTALAADFQLGVMPSPTMQTPPDWQARHIHGGVYFYVFRYPAHGLYLIDAGLPTEGLKCVPYPVKKMLKFDTALTPHTTTAKALADENTRGVFLTHMHFDHFLGIADLSLDTPVYVGPGEGTEPLPLSLILKSVTNCAFKWRLAPRLWQFQPDAESGRAGIIDVFGDGSLFAISVPGHTAGSTAYLANAVDGVHLITGDVAQTQVAWDGSMVDKSASDPDYETLRASL